MADFLTAYKETAAVEGSYSNHKNDSGGETWKGIARNKWPKWRGWKIVDSFKKLAGFPNNLKSSDELQIAVLEFYKENFWNTLKLGEIKSQKIANELAQPPNSYSGH
jgi:lysozyme family protein